MLEIFLKEFHVPFCLIALQKKLHPAGIVINIRGKFLCAKLWKLEIGLYQRSKLAAMPLFDKSIKFPA